MIFLKIKKSIIALAIILGVLSVGLLYYYIEVINATPTEKVELSNVVVAVSSIPEHVKITSEMVTIISLPVEAVHPDAAKTIEEVVGFTTKVEIFNDEQLLKSKVATNTENVTLSYRIPENMRAITIPMNEISGVAGYIEKGDNVDILVTYNDPAVDPTVLTLTQFQNIQVLEKGPKVVGDTTTTTEQGVATSLTLLVSPEQAEVIAFAVITGNMHMTLRNPVDIGIEALTQFNAGNFSSWRER